MKGFQSLPLQLHITEMKKQHLLNHSKILLLPMMIQPTIQLMLNSVTQ